MIDSLSNTLGLQAFLEDHAKSKPLVPSAIARIRHFPDKYKDGFFNLMGESQMSLARFNEACRTILGRPVTVTFVGVEDLMPNEEEQLRLYRLVHETALHKLLPVKRCVDDCGNLGVKLFELVKLSLGTHKLRKILDRTYGHDFSRILKRNITAAWYCYFCAVLRGDEEGAKTFGVFCEDLTKTLPVGLIKDGSLLSFVQRNDTVGELGKSDS